MKKKSITRYYIIVAILSVLVMSWRGGTSSEKSKNPQITITTEVEVGTLFSFYFERSANDTAAIWVDLNNDKVQDEGELIYPDELTEFKGILDASTFTIYGDISYINLNVKKITDLDISKCPNLKEIRATSNKLTCRNCEVNPGVLTWPSSSCIDESFDFFANSASDQAFPGA